MSLAQRSTKVNKSRYLMPIFDAGDCNGITLDGGECMVSCRAAGSPHHLNIPAAHLGQNCDNITAGEKTGGGKPSVSVLFFFWVRII